MAQADDDPRLLNDCLAGRPGAWEAFVERFGPFLAEICRRTLKRRGLPAGRPEAEDLLQEVLLLFLDRDMLILRSYRGQASVSAYLATVAVHRVLKEKRSTAPESSGEEPLSTAAGPEEVAETREMLARLRTEVGHLAPKAQLAVSLRADGASVEEVGRVLGLSEDAAAQLLSRTRAELRERLKE